MRVLLLALLLSVDGGVGSQPSTVVLGCSAARAVLGSSNTTDSGAELPVVIQVSRLSAKLKYGAVKQGCLTPGIRVVLAPENEPAGLDPTWWTPSV